MGARDAAPGSKGTDRADLARVRSASDRLLRRWAMMIKFPLMSGDALKAAELDRQGARAIILPSAGFSFSALLALVVLDANRVQGLRVPILLLLLSFLAFYSSLNLQSYKIRRWEDQIATGLKEAASGWLLLSVVAVVNGSAGASTHGRTIRHSAAMAPYSRGRSDATTGCAS